MEPLPSSGDRILIDVGQQVPVPPGIFVIWDGMGLVAKRVEHVPNSDPPKVLIKSINRDYHDYEQLSALGEFGERERLAVRVSIGGRVVAVPNGGDDRDCSGPCLFAGKYGARTQADPTRSPSSVFGRAKRVMSRDLSGRSPSDELVSVMDAVLKRWQVDFSDPGGQRRAKLFERRKEADQFLVKVRPQVLAGT